MDDARTNPAYGASDVFYDNERIAEYDRELQRLCERKSLPYIAVDEALEPADLIDGVHPSAEGHDMLAACVITRLRQEPSFAKLFAS